MDQGTAAVLGAIVSLGGAIFTAVYGSSVKSRIVQLQHTLDKERADEERRGRSRILMEKYRDPLLRSAQELQSRLGNIVCGRYLSIGYKRDDPDDPESGYAVNSTMYAVAEYLCWREVVRREMPYLDLGNVAKNTALMKQLSTIEDAFASDTRRTSSKTFCLFRHRQRAMGEVMMVDRTRPGPVRLDCIGFAAFTQRVQKERDFASWFKPLEADIRALAVASSKNYERLVDIQGALIGLLNLLDPDGRLVPLDRAMIEDPETKERCRPPSGNGTSSASAGQVVTEQIRN
jgi:hypothetical protein